MKELGLYIHIPFCASKCSYCALYSGFFDTSKIEEYVTKVLRETDIKGGLFGGREISTVYTGGGTPSYINFSFIRKILRQINRNFNVSREAEISIEINPESATEEALIEYINSGINRFSFGIQVYDDLMLTKLSRSTRVKNINKLVEILEKLKIKNYSFDLIYAFPELTDDLLNKTLDFVLNTNAKHISAYNYSLEEPSLMAKQIKAGVLQLPTDKQIKRQNKIVLERLSKAGFKQYELSNYSKPGYECKHNLNFWKGGEYIGLGVSSVSYINGCFTKNGADINRYIENGFETDAEVTELSIEEQYEKNLLLGLRLNEGIELKNIYENIFQTAEISETLKNNWQKQLEIKLHKVLLEELVDRSEYVENKKLVLTDKGREVIDYTLAKLI